MHLFKMVAPHKTLPNRHYFGLGWFGVPQRDAPHVNETKRNNSLFRFETPTMVEFPRSWVNAKQVFLLGCQVQSPFRLTKSDLHNHNSHLCQSLQLFFLSPFCFYHELGSTNSYEHRRHSAQPPSSGHHPRGAGHR